MPDSTTATAPAPLVSTSAFFTYSLRFPRSISITYTPASTNAVATYDATVPCATSYGIALLNIADHGRTLATSPPKTSNPAGWFIHAFTLITKSADAADATAIGVEHSQ